MLYTFCSAFLCQDGSNPYAGLIFDSHGNLYGTTSTGGQSRYPTAPCRVWDTRHYNGAFNGELTVNVAGSVCAPPTDTEAYVFNATAVPSGALYYLTLWPDSENQPTVSTPNAIDGQITSNMAITPNVDGSIDAYASGLTQLNPGHLQLLTPHRGEKLLAA